jgi:hypothetical protein
VVEGTGLENRQRATVRGFESHALRRCVALLALALLPHAAPAQDALEQRWLARTVPVLRYAEQRALPVDIVLLSAAHEDHPPLGVGFKDGRCKLVLALRGNRLLRGMLADVPDELWPTVAEAMVAHELGHCWRQVRGLMHTLPDDSVEAVARVDGDAEVARLRREMTPTRREEAYADLVSLAWVRGQRPEHYARVYDWLVRVRRHPHGTAVPHDTRSWLRLVADPAALDAAGGADVFERAQALWEQALHGRR